MGPAEKYVSTIISISIACFIKKSSFSQQFDNLDANT